MTNKRPLNDNTRLCCIICFEEYLKEDFLYAERSKIYDFLSAAGFLELTKKEKQEFYSKAQNILIEEELKKPKPQQKIGFIKAKGSLSVIFKSKVLAL